MPLLKSIAQGRSDRFDKMEGSPSSQTLEGSDKIILKVAQAPQQLKDHEEQVIYCTQQALENLEDHVEQLKQCLQVDFAEQKPEWLENFLTRTFFVSCPIHPFRRNELNKYCIDCEACLCQYCLLPGSHEDHRLLKIHRHVYKDVVPRDEIKRHIDCSQIQPYKCNRQQVIALSPLPHSGPKTNEEVTCQTCKRKLIEYIYSYCSISCKVEACPNTKDWSTPPPPPPPPPPDQPEKKDNEEPMSTRNQSRKGIPHRSPFF